MKTVARELTAEQSEALSPIVEEVIRTGAVMIVRTASGKLVKVVPIETHVDSESPSLHTPEEAEAYVRKNFKPAGKSPTGLGFYSAEDLKKLDIQFSE